MPKSKLLLKFSIKNATFTKSGIEKCQLATLGLWLWLRVGLLALEWETVMPAPSSAKKLDVPTAYLLKEFCTAVDDLILRIVMETSKRPQQ